MMLVRNIILVMELYVGIVISIPARFHWIDSMRKNHTRLVTKLDPSEDKLETNRHLKSALGRTDGASVLNRC